MSDKETQRRTLKDRDLEAIHALQRAEARHRELERGETFSSKRERDDALGPRLEELREAQSRADATALRAQETLRRHSEPAPTAFLDSSKSNAVAKVAEKRPSSATPKLVTSPRWKSRRRGARKLRVDEGAERAEVKDVN